jgi:GNAT superfamily N-acetyltransferase
MAAMNDLLVKLYALPSPRASPAGIDIRRAFAAERRFVCDWVAANFTDGWASECEASFARLPVACFVAMRDRDLLGFACYDAAARGLFGPTGVDESERRRGIGSALLIATLHDMAAQGYAYAIIGRPESPDFYRQHVDAIEIPNSDPGFYRGLIKQR